ncbi:MAG: hypothetical protein AAB092_04125, partial [Chloroflexota bacterium]
MDDVLTGLAGAIATTNYVATADASSDTLTVVNKGTGALTMSLDRGTAKDVALWSKSVVIAGTINDGDDWTVTVNYGSSSTRTFTNSNLTVAGANTATNAATAVASFINADPDGDENGTPNFYAVSSGATLTIFSGDTSSATSQITSVSVISEDQTIPTPLQQASSSAPAAAKGYVELTGTAAAGKVWTIGLTNGTTTDSYSFVATTSSLADVVTGLVTAINAGTEYSAADSTHNGTTVPSITITRLGASAATAFTPVVATPAATFADAATWAETVQLSGTVVTNKAWALSAKNGSAYEAFGYAAASTDTTLALTATGLAGAVTGTNYRAVATGNDTVTLFRIDGTATTVSTTAPTATLSDASAWTETIKVAGTAAADTVWAAGLKQGTSYETFGVVATGTDTLATMTTALQSTLDGSANYIAIESGNDTITILRQGASDTNAFSALTTLGANPSDAATWSEAIQVSGTVAAGKTYTVSLTPTSGSPAYFNYTATAADTLDTVTTALSSLIDASTGYATVVTGATGSKVIHVLQQGATTGITSNTTLATAASVVTAYTETIEIGGTIAARETWNVTLTPTTGSAVTFSYVAGSGSDTANAQTVAQSLAT